MLCFVSYVSCVILSMLRLLFIFLYVTFLYIVNLGTVFLLAKYHVLITYIGSCMNSKRMCNCFSCSLVLIVDVFSSQKVQIFQKPVFNSSKDPSGLRWYKWHGNVWKLLSFWYLHTVIYPIAWGINVLLVC